MVLFEWYILQNTIGKTVGVVCQPFRVVRRHLEEAYLIPITGEGLSYQARLIQHKHCPECVADLDLGLLVNHH